MFQLGFASAILADFSLDHVLAFAHNHGFHCVELMCWPKVNNEKRRYAGVTHINVDGLDERELKHIDYLFRKFDVSVSALGYYPNPLDPDPDKSKFYIDHLLKVIDAAALLKIPVVNTFIGRDPSRNLDDNLAIFREVWPDIVKHAEKKRIKIGIENCPMYFTKDEWPGGKNLAISPAIWDKMFDIIPSPTLGLNYDPSHMIWQMMDEIKPIYDYSDRLHHIHLKDVKIYKDKLNKVGIMAHPLEYHSPKLPGLGDVNWGKFFAALTDVRYRGPVVIEVEDKAYEGAINDIKSALLTSRNYIKQYLGF